MTQQELQQLIACYYEQLEALRQTVNHLQQQLDDVPKKISHYDLVQSDLLHELELMRLNAVQGTKVLTALRRVRQERRVYKNMFLFSQQEQKNLQMIAELKMTVSPFVAQKTYTYRTEEGYALHESLQGKHGAAQTIKPPKVKASEQALPTKATKLYEMTRKGQKWQLRCNDQEVMTYAKLKSMKTYLAEHNIVLHIVHQHEELFREFLFTNAHAT